MSGIVCGNCTSALGKVMGCQVKHDTVAEVQACFDRKYEYDAMVEADYEPIARGWCDNYVAHEAHVYQAINHETYSCSGMTQAELDSIIEHEDNAVPCEHGMNADLCSGPNHYLTYAQEKAMAGF